MRLRLAAMLASACLIAGCASDDGVDPNPEPPEPQPNATVTADDFGDEWPLIPDTATLICLGGGEGATLVVQAGGITYALDEEAEESFPPIDPIWEGDPADPDSRPSLEPLIERAGELCA